MNEIVTLINSFGTQILLGAVGLGIIGVGMGTVMGVIGYRHGSDVSRTAVVGMILLIIIRVVAATFASKVGVNIG